MNRTMQERENGAGEDSNMDVEEEVVNKKKLDEERRRLQKQLRDLEIQEIKSVYATGH